MTDAIMSLSVCKITQFYVIGIGCLVILFFYHIFVRSKYMNNMDSCSIKKAIGWSLIVFFASAVIAGSFNVCRNYLGLTDSTVSYVVYMLTNLATSLATLWIARSRSCFNIAFGQVAAYVVASIYLLYAINMASGLFAGFWLFGLFGEYFILIIDLLTALFVIGYLFMTKTWLPIKIVGTAIYVVYLFMAIVSRLISYFWQDYNENFDTCESLFAIHDGLSVTSFGLNNIALALTIVWLATRVAMSRPTER